ncbi:MAG: hypothetical protein ACE1Y3_02505 [Rhodospirillales bacterium]
MRYRRIAGAAFVAGAILAVAAMIGTPATAHERGGHGPGIMGPGMGHGYGMMGYGRGMGHGYGMMGHGHGMGHDRGMGHGRGMGHAYGMGHGTGHGHGMMGRGGKSGCGPGAMGGSSVDKELGVEDVTKILEGRLAWRGNDRLKVGKVEEKDEKTIIAEIVTVDDSLVKRLEFDRRTGRHRRIR